MVDLAQTIEEWRDLCSIKVDDQVRQEIKFAFSNRIVISFIILPKTRSRHAALITKFCLL